MTREHRQIAAIMDRDLKNVYDLSVSQNLEESEKRFAAKILDVVQPCSVEDYEGPPNEGSQFAGTFLETGVRVRASIDHPCFKTFSVQFF